MSMCIIVEVGMNVNNYEWLLFSVVALNIGLRSQAKNVLY